MSTLADTHQKEIIFTRKRMAATTEEISKIFVLYRSLERHLLSETEKWRAAQAAQAQGKYTEPCPVCQNPEATCQHGVRDAGNGIPVHLWHCPECGDFAPFVGYDCPICAAIAAQAEIETAVSEAERVLSEVAE